jgi:hypothetical protein
VALANEKVTQLRLDAPDNIGDFGEDAPAMGFDE